MLLTTIQNTVFIKSLWHTQILGKPYTLILSYFHNGGIMALLWSKDFLCLSEVVILKFWHPSNKLFFTLILWPSVQYILIFVDWYQNHLEVVKRFEIFWNMIWHSDFHQRLPPCHSQDYWYYRQHGSLLCLHLLQRPRHLRHAVSFSQENRPILVCPDVDGHNFFLGGILPH